jgi:nucleotidyltransferase/DNA polymerase involved in DNA repair
MTPNAKKYLIDLGMKDLLVNKLSVVQQDQLASFAMDNVGKSNLLQMLIQLSCLETRGKMGSIILAAQGVATVQQLKNLEISDVEEVFDYFNFHKDADLAQKEVIRMLVSEQQEKIYNCTSGQKGEEFQGFEEAEE